MPYDPSYPTFQMYPKWVCGVLANDAAAEREIQTAAAAEVEAPEPEPARPATDAPPLVASLPKPSTGGIIAAPIEAMPPKPEPARPPVSTVVQTRPTPSQDSSTSASVRPPSSAMTRMQLMRQRRRTGKRAIQLEISAVQIAGLVMAGCLDPVRQNDVAEIALAIGRLLDPVVARIPKDT